MEKKLFINLAVKDLDQSIDFFKRLGFSFNPQFTDETAACMIISSNSFVMLLTEAKFKEFTKKSIVNAKNSTEVLVCLSLEQKEEVDQMLKNALDAGAQEAREKKDYGFMYERSFEDLDGHIWELVWMDPTFSNA